MEMELRRLEDLAESIVNDFAYMRAREEEMRDTNGNEAIVCICVIFCACRVYKYACALLQHFLNVLSSVPSSMAADIP